MSAALANLALLLAAWLSFAALTSLAISLTWRGLAARSRTAHPRQHPRRHPRRHPRQRANVALAAALAPSLLPSLLLLACLAPGLATLLGHDGDHCLQHADHPHLCLVHAVGGPLDAPGAWLLGLALAGLAIGLARAVLRVRDTRRWLARLARPIPRATNGPVVYLDSSRPFSFVAGLLRPRIFLSASLADTLEPDQLAVVLAHERAHQARRDPLRRAAAEASSLMLPPRTRRAILEELALASEQTCDEQAAAALGDRLAVAEVLVAVERLAQRASLPGRAALPAFGGSQVATRVHSLLEAPPRDRSRGVGGAVAALATLAGLWLAAEPLHHLTEHWIRLLF